ncbi:GNAT family N-acetyltransferase [Caldimonas sp. KR1-144]|uniref:GNAT family N-acetyltransferase n=1 Tax=Caldimonas sp. KR1-144 TaxID=3400911 RepID=UPI003C04FFB0
MHLNPDHFLQTESGRVLTPQRNRAAWTRCHAALETALGAARPPSAIYLLIGPQGSGKSTWVRAHGQAESPDAVFFDAILVKRSERAEVLARVKPFGVAAIAVWLRTPLATCLARNARRPADEVVSEQAIRNVFAALEPPSLSEGFDRIIEIACDTGAPTARACPEAMLSTDLDLSFHLTSPADVDALVAVRIDAMRESLERIGRFDPLRARERFLSGFEPGHTRHIVVAGQRVGFFVVKPREDHLLLDHLYVVPAWQGRGIGAAVLRAVFDEADALGAPVRVGALKHSASNRFYLRHGFRLVKTGEYDNYYVRGAR